MRRFFASVEPEPVALPTSLELDESDSTVTVVFEQAGGLGLGLASRTSHSAPLITELTPGSQAAAFSSLAPGMKLYAVNGQEVHGMMFDQVLHLIRVTPRPTALTFVVPRPRSPPAVQLGTPAQQQPRTPQRPAPVTPNILAAESEDLAGDYEGLQGTPRELQLASPMARQESMRSSIDRKVSAASRAGETHESDIIAQGLDESGGGSLDGSRLRLDVSARRVDPLNSSSANLAHGDMAVFRQKIEGAAKVVAPLSQRSESGRIAFVAAHSALDELLQAKAMLSQQLLYLMTHSDSSAPM